MANNYTVVNSSTLEFSGDSVATATIPVSNTLTIVPNANYVISASDFSIGSTLPIEVTSVTFTDTIAAYDVSNHVLVNVTLAQWYTMPAADATLEVDIDGTAKRGAHPRLSFTGIVNVIGSQDAKFVIAGSDSTTVSEATASSIKTHSIRQDIRAGSKALVARFEINANTVGTGFYPSLPQYEIISSNPSRWSSKVTTLLYGDYNVYAKAPTTNNTSNARNGEITIYKIEFYYEMGNSAVALSEGESIVFTQPTEVLWTTQTPVVSIDKIRYSNYKNQGILPSRDIDLSLNVLGSPGATYDILVMDDNGLSYDFALNAFTRSLTKSSEQTINLGSPTITTRSNNHTIAVPAYNEKAALAKYLTTTVTPTGSTKTTPNGTSTAPHVITLNQFGEVDFTANVTPATYGVRATTATLLSFLNKKPLSYPTIFNPTDFPLLSTTNNSYFNISTPLSYTVNGVVSSVSTVTITLAVTAASLKLQVGDSVTGTNVGTARTIVTIADPDADVIVLSGVDGTVSGTLVFTRNVGISRQPLATDFNCSITSEFYSSSYPSFTVTAATTNSTTVEVIDQEDADYSSIYNSHTVQGESIIGYPTVISGGKSKDLVLSSFQTLPSGEVLSFSNAMSDYEIVDINVTGAGTTNCKLNVEGYANRVGYANVIEGLVLDNFITSYVAPVATAQAVDCPLGGGVKIFPLATSHTSVLTIAAIAGSGRSATASGTISDDGSYLLYLAPTTGTTETITYTVNDGINTSASANIVVTLT